MEDKTEAGAEDQKAAEGSEKLALPYNVLEALEPDLYCNEFDVWQDSCKKQKTDYVVFAGRRYSVGDKCQIYYNAFIQELGTQATEVTVFIEELGEKRLVPWTNLKPVRKTRRGRKRNSYNHPEQSPGETDPEMHGRRWYVNKPHRKEMAESFSRPQPGLPACLQHRPGKINPDHSLGAHRPALPPAGVAYEHYRPQSLPNPPCGCGSPRSSAQFLNRLHLTGPDIANYSSPKKRCYQRFEKNSFRSRRRMHSLNKEYLSCVPEPGEETQDIEGSITFCETKETDKSAFSPIPDEAVSSPMVPGATAYWVPEVPSSVPSEKDPDEWSNADNQGEYSEEHIYSAAEAGSWNLSVCAAAAATGSTTNPTTRAGSPQKGVATHSYSHQACIVQVSQSFQVVVKSSQPINSAPAAIFTSKSFSSCTVSTQARPNPLQPSNITPGQPPAQNVLGSPAPWFVNELGEPVAIPPPPPYSDDPHGSDLPRDHNVLQYYYNLGVYCYQMNYWHYMRQAYPQLVAENQFQPYPSTVPAADRMVPQAYPDPVRMHPHPHGVVPGNGTPLAVIAPAVVPSTVFHPQPPLHPSCGPYPALSTTCHDLTPRTPGACPQTRPLPHPCHVHYNTAPTCHCHLPCSQFL